MKSPTNGTAGGSTSGIKSNANKSGSKGSQSDANAKIDAWTIKYIEEQKIDSTKKKLEMELQ